MEKSSFFNSELVGETYDRVYLAEDYAEYFASFIGNGVFANPSSNLQIVANDNMTVTLKAGKGWIDGYFYHNTDDLIISIDVADGVLNRIDRVVLRLDFINREIKAYVKKGVFASLPVAIGLQRDADMYELALADVKINKGDIKITQANITDLRLNSSLCGIVKGTIEEIDVTNLFAQYQVSFEEWFKNVQYTLGEDVAGNLVNKINENANAISLLTTATNKQLDKKANLVNGKVPINELPQMDFIPTNEKGVPNGVAQLDANGKLNISSMQRSEFLYRAKRNTTVTLSNIDMTKYRYLEIILAVGTEYNARAFSIVINDTTSVSIPYDTLTRMLIFDSFAFVQSHYDTSMKTSYTTFGKTDLIKLELKDNSSDGQVIVLGVV